MNTAENLLEMTLEIDDKTSYDVEYVGLKPVQIREIANSNLKNSVLLEQYKVKLMAFKRGGDAPSEEDVSAFANSNEEYTELVRETVGALIKSITYKNNKTMVSKVDDITDARIIQALAGAILPKAV